jgi:hypothetical protein
MSHLRIGGADLAQIAQKQSITPQSKKCGHLATCGGICDQ